MMNEWFECKVKYERTMDDGKVKKVNEPYLVDALSFTEAEERISEERKHYMSGEFQVSDIKRARYAELFETDDESADRWFKVKLTFITLDEKSGKEKRSNVNYLVQAANMNGAIKNIDTVMGGTMIDYVIANISETRIMDVYEHNAPKKQERDDKPEYEEEK